MKLTKMCAPASSLALLLLCAAPTWSQILSDYRDDFQGPTPATGWSYQYNNGGAIGTASNYTDLVFAAAGNRYTSDGNNSLPRPDPAGFVLLGATTVHPGLGSTQGGSSGIDRFAIANYTVQPGDAGRLAISNSLLTRSNTATTNTGVDLHIYVNDALARTIAYPVTATPHAFNTLLGNVNAGDTIRVAVGPQGAAGSDGTSLDFSVQAVNSFNDVVVGNYRNDYQSGGPAADWQYQWNSGGAIGNPSNYSDLVVSGSIYDVDGAAGPGPNPGAFVNLNANGGHPGRGTGDAGSGGLDSYAIAAFTIAEDGQYALTDSFLDTVDNAGNGGDVYVHVNGDAPVLHTFFDNASGANIIDFDTFLGDLVAGDVVYVGVGPNGADGNDGFLFDFSITQLQAAPVPEPSAIAIWAMVGLGLMAWPLVRRLRHRA